MKPHHTNILGVSFNFFICTTVQVNITRFHCRSAKMIPVQTKYIIFSCKLKAETHDATNRGDTLPCLHCCCNKSLALSLLLR